MKGWILSVVLVAIFSYAVKIIMPSGKMQKTLAFIMSLISLFVIISPLKGIKDSGVEDYPVFNPNENYEEFFDKCINDYYLTVAKIGLKKNDIQLVKANFEFDKTSKNDKLKKIIIYLSDLVIIGNNQHINITSEVKDILSELFSLPTEMIIVIEKEEESKCQKLLRT